MQSLVLIFCKILKFVQIWYSVLGRMCFVYMEIFKLNPKKNLNLKKCAKIRPKLGWQGLEIWKIDLKLAPNKHFYFKKLRSKSRLKVLLK
jgi:hypothetical protein